MYQTGRGLPQDYAEATKWYRRAAEQGYSNAQVSVGVMYANGLGVPQDYVQAHIWFSRAVGSASDTAGRDQAVKYRETIGAHMTPMQIAEAQSHAS
jgi:TPR repeat protein